MTQKHEPRKPAAPSLPVPAGPGDYPEVHPVRRITAGATPRTLVFLHGGNVGNWSWDPQVLAFGDFNVMTLHLPAFGARSEESWQGLESAADDVAALIADEVSEGGVHLVGMSLGGVIALHVAARHPELVESLLVTGTPVAGVPATARALSRMQLKLLGSEWYWRFQAGAHGMVDDERELFASHGLRLKPANMRAIKDELEPGGLPSNLTSFNAPVLVLAGAREPRVVQKSFEPLRTLLPQAITRLVPGMHHQWNIEDPVFFNAVVRRWVLDGVVHSRLVDPDEASQGARPGIFRTANRKPGAAKPGAAKPGSRPSDAAPVVEPSPETAPDQQGATSHPPAKPRQPVEGQRSAKGGAATPASARPAKPAAARPSASGPSRPTQDSRDKAKGSTDQTDVADKKQRPPHPGHN